MLPNLSRPAITMLMEYALIWLRNPEKTSAEKLNYAIDTIEGLKTNESFWAGLELAKAFSGVADKPQ